MPSTLLSLIGAIRQHLQYHKPSVDNVRSQCRPMHHWSWLPLQTSSAVKRPTASLVGQATERRWLLWADGTEGASSKASTVPLPYWQDICQSCDPIRNNRCCILFEVWVVWCVNEDDVKVIVPFRVCAMQASLPSCDECSWRAGPRWKYCVSMVCGWCVYMVCVCVCVHGMCVYGVYVCMVCVIDWCVRSGIFWSGGEWRMIGLSGVCVCVCVCVCEEIEM